MACKWDPRAAFLQQTNHVLATAAVIRGIEHQTIARDIFEDCGLSARLGASAASLVQPGGSNYDLAVLHASIDACGARLFPMLTGDLEGTTARTSQLAGSRFDEPFMQHVLPEGAFEVAGYVLRIPSRGGHWVAICLPGYSISPGRPMLQGSYVIPCIHYL